MTPRISLLASMLREQCGIAEQAPVDLEDIVGSCLVELAETPLDGFLGLYVPPPDGPAILLNSNQSPDQRRFTLAHELGHFALPKHAESVQAMCLADDVLSPRAQPLEREANQFAAELLMPKSLFGRAIRDRDCSFATVKELADRDRFWVSRTAAAIRMVELSRESCALVCFERGRLKWLARSSNCDFYIERDVGNEAPPGSVAQAVLGGEADTSNPEEVDPATWCNPRGRYLTVSESTMSIPSFDQVLSIIWSQTEVEDS